MTCSALCREPGESEYEWVREYTYKVQNAEDRTTFWFLFNDECVTYCDLNTRLDLRKRSRARKEGESEFQRPSKVGLGYVERHNVALLWGCSCQCCDDAAAWSTGSVCTVTGAHVECLMRF